MLELTVKSFRNFINALTWLEYDSIHDFSGCDYNTAYLEFRFNTLKLYTNDDYVYYLDIFYVDDEFKKGISVKLLKEMLSVIREGANGDLDLMLKIYTIRIIKEGDNVYIQLINKLKPNKHNIEYEIRL